MYVKNATAFNEAIKRSANEGKAVFALLNGEKHETLKFRSKKGHLQAQIQSGSWISVDTVVVEEREQKPEQIQEVVEEQKGLDLRSFKKWLRKNKDRTVGYVGSYVQMHPLLQYAQECNIYLPSILKSRWGSKFRKLCMEYNGIPGRITGHECQCLLADVIGYYKAFV